MQAKRSLEPTVERQYVKRMFPLERILNKGFILDINKLNQHSLHTFSLRKRNPDQAHVPP